MIEYFRMIVAAQFEAALCMLNDCLVKCPDRHWDGIIGKYPFWRVAYHTLCYVDLYLTTNEESFQFRPIHPAGWEEFREEHPSRKFERQELADYLAICRQKLSDIIAGETEESLKGPSGFEWLKFTRGEAHLYNMRHLQHHTGQLSAFLRRVDQTLQDRTVVRWVSRGWK